MKVQETSFRWMVLCLALSGLMIVGCGDDDGVTTPEITEFEVIQPAIHVYTSNTNQGPVITAQALFDNMNDGNAANDYFVLSVRSADHFALGHIPGAINIPWREIGQEARLALLSTDQAIAVYCYTGHTGGIATALLNAMGYEAYNLKFGMGAWTKDEAIRVAKAFDETVDAHDFQVETQINEPTATFEIPTTDFSTSTVANLILRAAADDVASNVTAAVTAQSLFDNLNDSDSSNDPIIVSVRSAEHYAIGHIPGAINIPWREIALEANLSKLDPNREIVVYCYTGHTGAVAATALNLLGYDAVNMKFGIMAWTRDAAVRVASPFREDVDAHDFPVEP
ncbi:rhodanese-like domain-containing protein [bacterium]|nr:rhodanese-like domain-containing protein [bacterium]